MASETHEAPNSKFLSADEIVEKLKLADVFTASEKIEIVQYEKLSAESNFMISSLFKLVLNVTKESSASCQLPLIVKQSVITFEVNWKDGKTFDSPLDSFFFNEVYFYENIYPKVYSKHSELFPKYYFGEASKDASHKIIILEDLTASGYRMTKSNISLSKQHINLIVKEMGTFHGLSYAYKENHPKEVEEFAKNVREVKYTEELRESAEKYQGMDRSTATCLMAIDHLETTGKYEKSLMDKLRKDFQNLFTFLMNEIQPTEPYATIIHGDFNRNNLMFAYNDRDEPTSLKLIDFQTPRYSSPACDLSFLMAMNVDTEDRLKNFDDYFTIYYDALISAIDENCQSYDFDKYSYDNILKDYGRHALYGWATMAYFYPAVYHGGIDRLLDLIKGMQKDGAVEPSQDMFEQLGKMLLIDEVKEYIYKCLEQICDKFYV